MTFSFNCAANSSKKGGSCLMANSHTASVQGPPSSSRIKKSGTVLMPVAATYTTASQQVIQVIGLGYYHENLFGWVALEVGLGLNQTLVLTSLSWAQRLCLTLRQKTASSIGRPWIPEISPYIETVELEYLTLISTILGALRREARRSRRFGVGQVFTIKS